jgi:hypothetical protein
VGTAERVCRADTVIMRLLSRRWKSRRREISCQVSIKRGLSDKVNRVSVVWK